MPVSLEEHLDDLNRPRDVMVRNGLTVEAVAKAFRAQMRAKETQFFSKDGLVTDSRDVVDWKTRQRATIEVAKILGMYPAERHEVTVDASEMTDEELDARIAALLAEGAAFTASPGAGAKAEEK